MLKQSRPSLLHTLSLSLFPCFASTSTALPLYTDHSLDFFLCFSTLHTFFQASQLHIRSPRIFLNPVVKTPYLPLQGPVNHIPTCLGVTKKKKICTHLILTVPVGSERKAGILTPPYSTGQNYSQAWSPIIRNLQERSLRFHPRLLNQPEGGAQPTLFSQALQS